MNAIFDPRTLKASATAASPMALFQAGRPVLANADAVARELDPAQPVFCFSPSRLRAQLARFQTGFPGEVSYAVKANPTAEVAATLATAGLAVFDVASIEEMEGIARVASNPEFHYHNPVKSRAEIAAAFEQHGCRRFAVDCLAELTKIADVLGARARGVEIAVRFRLPSAKASAHDFSSKFGADETGAALLLRQARLMGFVPCLTFHPGSQCRTPAAYRRHIEAAARIAAHAGVTLHALNVGGGFPVAYAGADVPELEAFFGEIAAATEEHFAADARPALECEPGRAMVATSMSLLARVKLVRRETGEVFLNDGIYGALMEVSQAPELNPHHRVLGDGGATARGEFTVFGPTCDPLDRLPHRLALPADIDEDDFIEFGMLGAYGSATATRFNGYGRADIVIVEDVHQG